MLALAVSGSALAMTCPRPARQLPADSVHGVPQLCAGRRNREVARTSVPIFVQQAKSFAVFAVATNAALGGKMRQSRRTVFTQTVRGAAEGGIFVARP